MSSKIPPNNAEVEKAVVGSMVIDESVIDIVAGIVAPEDFYEPATRAIYDAALLCRAKGKPVDFQTLQTVLTHRRQLDMVGGISGLSDVLDSVPTAANAEAYATTVKELAVLRRLINACTTVAEDAYDAGENIEMFLAEAQGKIVAATDHSSDTPWVHLGALAGEEITSLGDREAPKPGLMTGFSDLDDMIKGLFPGQLIVVAGRPSSGKTAFAMSMILQAIMGSEKRLSALICSLEMDRRAVTNRYISMLTGIPIANIRSREISQDDWTVLDAARRDFMELPIYIADRPAMTLAAIRARARRLQAQHGLDLIVVDYLQLMKAAAEKDANRERQVASVSAGLKEIAKEFSVPVIALSQLNRAVEGRPDKRPGMADLRESGAIEQDADVIMFVFREWLYDPQPENKDKAEIIIGKQRDGMVGKVELEFDGPRVTFSQQGGFVRRPKKVEAVKQPEAQPDPEPDWIAKAVSAFASVGIDQEFLLDEFGPAPGWNGKKDAMAAFFREQKKRMEEK